VEEEIWTYHAEYELCLLTVKRDKEVEYVALCGWHYPDDVITSKKGK